MYTLSKGEEIVKSWEYAQVQQDGKQGGASKKKTNLTVTNKRLIHTTKSEDSYTRSEFPLAKIKKIEGTCSKNSDPSLLKKAIIGFVTGGIFIIAGIVLWAMEIDVIKDYFWVLCVFGGMMVGVGFLNLYRYFRSRASAFMLRIEMDGSASDGMGVSISSSNFNHNKKENKKHRQADVVLVHVDYNAALQILEELGAFVEDAKTNAYHVMDEEKAA